MKNEIAVWVGIHAPRETAAILEQYIFALAVTLAKRDGYSFPCVKVKIDGNGVVTESVTPDVYIEVHQQFNQETPHE